MPEPLSPTMQTVSPGPTSKETSSTPTTVPALVSNSTRRLRTSAIARSSMWLSTPVMASPSRIDGLRLIPGQWSRPNGRRLDAMSIVTVLSNAASAHFPGIPLRHQGCFFHMIRVRYVRGWTPDSALTCDRACPDDRNEPAANAGDNRRKGAFNKERTPHETYFTHARRCGAGAGPRGRAGRTRCLGASEHHLLAGAPRR